MAIALLPIISGFVATTRFGTILAGLVAVLSSLFDWFLNYVSRKWAMNFSIIAMVVGLGLTAFAAIELIAAGISLVVPGEYTTALALIVPSNASTCMAAILSCKTVRWMFIWQAWAIDLGR